MPRVSIQEEQNAAPSMMEAVQCNYSATKVTSLSPSSGTKSCVSQHSLGLKAGGLETKADVHAVEFRGILLEGSFLFNLGLQPKIG